MKPHYNFFRTFVFIGWCSKLCSCPELILVPSTFQMLARSFVM